MLRRLTVVLGVAFIAAAVACGFETPGVDALQRDLRQEYPDAQLEVSFINTTHHLELTVDTAVYGNYRLDDSQRRALGEEMARFVLDHYGAAADLDSISIEFVQERSGWWVLQSWSMIREIFVVADLR